MRIVLAALLAASPLAVCMSTPASAQESVYAPGGYWIVQGIYLEPGQFENYADYLAGQYVKNQEFAKQQGWITGYRMLVNVNRRRDEPDLYLITEVPRLPTPQEQSEREKKMNAAMATTTRQAEEASGQRVTMRRLGSNTMLQEMIFKSKPR